MYERGLPRRRKRHILPIEQHILEEIDDDLYFNSGAKCACLGYCSRFICVCIFGTACLTAALTTVTCFYYCNYLFVLFFFLSEEEVNLPKAPSSEFTSEQFSDRSSNKNIFVLKMFEIVFLLQRGNFSEWSVSKNLIITQIRNMITTVYSFLTNPEFWPLNFYLNVTVM